MKRRMLSPNVSSIQQRTFSIAAYYIIFFGNTFNFGSRWIFGLPDAYECVVRPDDHDMARCLTIISRLRRHIFGGRSDRYSFIAVDFHRLLLAGLPAYSPQIPFALYNFVVRIVDIWAGRYPRA